MNGFKTFTSTSFFFSMSFNVFLFLSLCLTHPASFIFIIYSSLSFLQWLFSNVFYLNTGQPWLRYWLIFYIFCHTFPAAGLKLGTLGLDLALDHVTTPFKFFTWLHLVPRGQNLHSAYDCIFLLPERLSWYFLLHLAPLTADLKRMMWSEANWATMNRF